MKKTLAFVLSATFVLGAGGTYSPPSYSTSETTVAVEESTSDPIMAQAAADLKAAKKAKAEWRFIDKAGGGSAQDMSKFMKIAEQQAAAGETEEAHRIAALISKYAKLGIAQAEKQRGAKPYYPQ